MLPLILAATAFALLFIGFKYNFIFCFFISFFFSMGAISLIFVNEHKASRLKMHIKINPIHIVYTLICNLLLILRNNRFEILSLSDSSICINRFFCSRIDYDTLRFKERNDVSSGNNNEIEYSEHNWFGCYRHRGNWIFCITRKSL